MEMLLNKYLSSIEELNIDSYPLEIKEAFYDFITNVPYIKSLISPDRPYAKDCPRDSDGKIVVDLTTPPIITDTDYFRPTAIHYLKYGCITRLRPNPNPNSEYGKWAREEVRRCYFGYIRPLDGAWITGDMYFFLNYCPIIKVKKVLGRQGIRVVDFPDFLEGQWLKFMYIDLARKNAKHGSELAKRGAGKAHPYDETIYTPNGKKLWGNLNIGDFVYGDDGNITKIIDIPFNGISPIYELELSNGNKVQCSEGHLWKVYSHAHGGRLITVTTKELLNIYKRRRKISDRNPNGVEYDCAIPNSKGVEFPYTPTKIDPYTFGLLLGDGCFRVVNCKSKTYFTSSDEDFSTYSSFIPYNWVKYNNTKFGYNLLIPEFGSILKEYGLYFKKSEDKFIPEEYKYNSRSTRLSILKGILDSDGTVSKNGRIEIVLTSKKLIEDIKWILSSLGINYTKERVKHSWYYNSNKERVKCLNCYRLSIYSNIPLFNLPRKLEVWKAGNKIVNNRSIYKGSKIINIRYIGEKPAKCITVDNLSHCYLISNFIVTHNSYCAASILAKRFLLGEFDEINKLPTKKVESFVASYLKNYLNEDGILNKFEGYIDFCAEATEFPRKRLISSMNNMHWQAGYKENANVAKKGSLNEVIGISVKDSAGKLRGKRGALIILEEFGSFPNLIELYGTLRPSMEDGDIVFGQIFALGCVCAGTKVFDKDNNLINIEDATTSIIGYNGNRASIEDITYLLPEAYKECVEIVTTNGSIKCSIDHPLLKLNKDNYSHSKNSCSFYRANELAVGDILLMHGNDRFGNIHVKEAYLLGALFGDGSYSENSCVTLSITTEEEYEYYNSNYNINISKLKETTNGGIYALIYFRGLHPLLKKYGMDKLAFLNKKFPNTIWQWDKESIADFLAGYFDADGNVQIVKLKHRSIKLSCIYKESVDQVCILLLKFGIFSYILKELKPSGVLVSTVNKLSYLMKESNVYVLYICNGTDIIKFRDNIKLKIKAKKERLDSYILQKGRNYYENLKFEYREENKKGKFFIDKNLEGLKGTKILSINNIGILRIYNLTANTTHTYLSNGFISSNTAGDKESDFNAALKIMYSPRAFNMLPIPNVYDKVGQGKKEFVYFYPAYLNRNGCYNKDGVSDVTKAILEVLINRYNVKYNTTDSNLIIKTIAEHPIVPLEAILRTLGSMFPVQSINSRINEIDNNPNEYDGVYIGNLQLLKDGTVKFENSIDTPIREYPIKDGTNTKGAIEIFDLPLKDSQGNIFPERYILGLDPVDDDVAHTTSLTSVFVLDLFTDRIVAEYTGRQDYADDNFEIVRRLCLFYNGKCLYESHPYNQLVILSNGIKSTWESVNVGTELLTIKGTTRVIDIPFNDYTDVYKVTLEDGREVLAGENHVWNVIKLNHPNKWFIMSTRLMLSYGVRNKHGQHNFFIPNAGVIDYPKTEVSIDPYTMGLMIAEGAFTKFTKNKKETFNRRFLQFSSSKEDAKFYKEVLPYEIKYIGTKGYSWHIYIDNIDEKLKSLGLLFTNSHNKFIPKEYLINDYESRLELLKGLMDGDGCASKNGASIYITTSERLCNDVLSLCRSLGINASYKKIINDKYEHYRISVYTKICIYKLPRKIEAQHSYMDNCKGSKANSFINKTAIKSIEFIGKEKSKCVTVDRHDGLYLIGDYVLTHNCNKKGIFAYFNKMNCLLYLAETPEYLKDQLIIKETGYGNKARGVNATATVNAFADRLTREWLIKPINTIVKLDGTDTEVTLPNLMFIKNKAFLQELAAYNPKGNYDRVRAFGMLMLYRQEKIILYQGDMNKTIDEDRYKDSAENDEFFQENYDKRFS